MDAGVIIAIVVAAGTLGLIGTIFSFVSKIVKGQQDVIKLKMQKEILELELQKQTNQIKLLEEEGKKYDKIINENP